MPSKERFAWVWLSAMAVSYSAYFTALAALDSRGELSLLAELGLLATAAAVQGLIIGSAALLAWIRRPRGHREETDERDRAIERRAASIAYYVLICEVMVVGCVMPLGAGGWRIVHAAILAIVIAEVVHYGLVVAAYRRGWHG